MKVAYIVCAGAGRLDEALSAKIQGSRLNGDRGERARENCSCVKCGWDERVDVPKQDAEKLVGVSVGDVRWLVGVPVLVLHVSFQAALRIEIVHPRPTSNTLSKAPKGAARTHTSQNTESTPLIRNKTTTNGVQ